MSGRGKQIAKQMSIVDTLIERFHAGGFLELKGKAVYFNAQYRKLNLAVEDLERALQVPGQVLSWKKDLEKAPHLTTPLSYYEKNGEERVSLVVKVPASLVTEVSKQYKSMSTFKVELKSYQDYPTEGKHGLWLQLHLE